jgi:carboxymethylenebutenolidase
MTDTTIPGGHGDLPVFLATPADPPNPPPWPGVVVIHDAMGMGQDVRNQARWLASEGYLAAAPDLFSWGSTLTCVRAAFREMRQRKGRIFEDAGTVRDWLIHQPGCSGRVGVIGFCMGGGFALLLAPDHGYDVASVNYGMVPKDAPDLLTRACPVVGSFGGRDRTMRGAAGRLESALAAAGVDHDVREYPAAGHGFLNDHEAAGDRIPLMIKATTPLMGYGPAPPAGPGMTAPGQVLVAEKPGRARTESR